MPTDRLTGAHPTPRPNPATPQQLADGVLAALAGEPTEAVAARIGTTLTHLEQAIELFQAAGRAALDRAHTTERSWYQLRVQFPSALSMNVGRV